MGQGGECGWRRGDHLDINAVRGAFEGPGISEKKRTLLRVPGAAIMLAVQ